MHVELGDKLSFVISAKLPESETVKGTINDFGISSYTYFMLGISKFQTRILFLKLDFGCHELITALMTQ